MVTLILFINICYILSYCIVLLFWGIGHYLSVLKNEFFHLFLLLGFKIFYLK